MERRNSAAKDARIAVGVGTQNRIFLRTNAETLKYIRAELLRELVPDFAPGRPTLLRVAYLDYGITVYHEYTGGMNWNPTAPARKIPIGDILTLKIRLLSPLSFVHNLPSVTFGNYFHADWMTDLAHVNRFFLAGDLLKMKGRQDPAVEGISSYTIRGKTSYGLGFNNGRVLLDFRVQDVFRNKRGIRISHNGYDTTPSLGVESGGHFLQILFMSYDGTRLKLLYNANSIEKRVATMYLRNPSTLYTTGNIDETVTPYVTGQRRAFHVENVTPKRRLEKEMMISASSYDLGRLGSEIACAVGIQKLGLNNLAIAEPSKGGPDLYTQDGKAVMQARMLTVTEHGKSPEQIRAAIMAQLVDMLRQLRTSFALTPSATLGYLSLTHLNPQDNLQTTVIEVQR